MAQSSPPPSSPAITVRPATVDDSSRLAEIHVRSWQEAYQGILTADFLAGLSIPDRVAFWETRLSSLEQNEAVLVAEVGAILAGFVLLGPARDNSGDGEVLAIYLDPDRWRQGIGSTLMAAAQERLASHGFGSAILWVLEHNERGRRFYEAMGWRLEPAIQVLKIGGVDVNEVRYRRKLT